MNLRDSVVWDRQLEEGLPDSRLSGMAREKTIVRLGQMEFERVFCASCGCSGGAVSAQWTPHIFYVCQECHDKMGPPPGAIEVSEAQVREVA